MLRRANPSRGGDGRARRSEDASRETALDLGSRVRRSAHRPKTASREGHGKSAISSRALRLDRRRSDPPSPASRLGEDRSRALLTESLHPDSFEVSRPRAARSAPRRASRGALRVKTARPREGSAGHDRPARRRVRWNPKWVHGSTRRLQAKCEEHLVRGEARERLVSDQRVVNRPDSRTSRRVFPIERQGCAARDRVTVHVARIVRLRTARRAEGRRPNRCSTQPSMRFSRQLETCMVSRASPRAPSALSDDL